MSSLLFRKLQLIDKNATGAASLRQHYQRLLLPFEEHEKEKVGNGAGLLGMFALLMYIGPYRGYESSLQNFLPSVFQFSNS